MEDKTLLDFLLENEYLDLKYIGGKGYCGLQRMNYTVGLFIGLDWDGREGRYCYPNLMEARQALKTWNGAGDPPGPWIKYKGSGGDRPNIKLAEKEND